MIFVLCAEHPVLSGTMDKYQKAWSDYRTRRNASWIEFVVLILLFIAICTFAKNITGIGWMLIPLLITHSIIQMRFLYFCCPRCGNTFNNPWGMNPLIRQKCFHCGLPKFASDGGDEQAHIS
jgi:hypothetical protein